MYRNRRGTSLVRWICVPLFLMLLVGCSSDDASLPAYTLPLPGLHFLAEAEVTLHTNDPDEITIDHKLFLLNGGEETCNNIFIAVRWPDELEDRMRRGSWDGPTQPVRPEDFGYHIGTWKFELAENERARLDEWIDSARINVECRSPIGYEVTVVPRVISHDDQ